jgi:hypothetical protein
MYNTVVRKLKKNMRAFLTSLILMGFVGISFGQINVNGGIYADSTLTKPMSRVKVILKSDSGNKTYRTDKYGKFNITTEKNITEFTLEIKKRKYITIVIEGIFKNKSFDVILRKALSVHDKGYEGSSELIMRN